MLQYTITSWHYKLVNYVFGKSFFFEEDLDHELISKERNIIEDKIRKKYPNDDDALETAYNEFHRNVFENDGYLKYTEKKPTSFCPYCRAVVTSIVVFPFVVLYKLIPKRKPKKLDHKESLKRMEIRSKIIRAACGGLNIALGIKAIVLDNSIEFAIIQFALGLGIIFMNQSAILIRKIYNSVYFGYKKIKKLLIKLHILKIKTKKIPKLKKQTTPNFIRAFFTENHSKYCPPVSFVDETDR